MAAEDRVLDYAKTIAGLLAPTHGVGAAQIAAVVDRADALAIADPQLSALLVAAVDVRDAIRDQQRNAFDTSSAAWLTARAALQDEILAALAAPVRSVPPLATLVRQARLDDPDGLRLDAPLGPLTVSLNAPGVSAEFPDPAGSLVRTVLGPLPPDLLTGSLQAGPAQGGGALLVAPDGLAGAFGLKLGVVDVSAIASLRLTPQQIPSFLGIMGVAFTPGIQLGFGFSLNRVGGLVGIDRHVQLDALSQRLRSGTAGDVLFSDNPAADAPRILGAVDQIFALLADAHLFGPTMQLGWLKLAGGSLFSLDLGVVVELPGPSRIVLVGVARAGIPPILRLRLDAFGALDFEQRLASVDASLVDSGALGVFTIAGDAAFRLSWGAQPYTLLSIGGFFPGFNPEPAKIRPLQRVSLVLDQPVPGVFLRASGYLAATSNTLQLGAAIEAGVQAGPVSASGFFQLDALIQFTPFHFHAEFAAGFEVKVRPLGKTFAGVTFNGIIDGPGPIVLDGRLTIETFLFDISWHETFTIGPTGGDTRVTLQSLLDELAPELARPENLRARGGTDHLVRLAPQPSSSPKALVSPLGQLVWSQRRAPLDVPIDRLEGVPLGSAQGARAALKTDGITPPTQQQADKALFSPGSFITLSQAEALNKPAFEQLDAGLALGWADLERSKSSAPRPDDFQIIRKVRGEPPDPPVRSLIARALVAAFIHDMLADRGRPSRVTRTDAMVDLVPEVWTTNTGRTHDNATAAHQDVRTGQARLALPQRDFARPVSLAGV